MSVKLTIDMKDAQAEIGRLIQQVKNTTPLMKEIGEIGLNAVHERFDRENAPDGTSWKPHAATTRRARLRKNGNAQLTLLRDSGQLAGSFHYKAGQSRVEIGSNKPYAAIQNSGGKAGRGRKVTIPARTILGISRQDKKDYFDAIKYHLTKK